MSEEGICGIVKDDHRRNKSIGMSESPATI
jgi:hypothetical protein